MALGFEVVTWNIQKGLNDRWVDYVHKNSQVSYWGIQEATSEGAVLDFFSEQFHTVYNPAWKNNYRSTGTLSSSTHPQQNVQKVITRFAEPFLKSPKSFVMSDIDFGCSDLVKVVNIHMINFLLGGAYQGQLNQISTYISAYKGPLIVLGDFNDWNWFRTKALFAWTLKHNLAYAATGQVPLAGIDHIFYRGLHLNSAFKANVLLSDHEPVHAVFSCH